MSLKTEKQIGTAVDVDVMFHKKSMEVVPTFSIHTRIVGRKKSEGGMVNGIIARDVKDVDWMFLVVGYPKLIESCIASKSDKP